MGDEKDTSIKRDETNPVKDEVLEDEGKKLSRDIARKYIYVRNKEKYPLPFEEYKIYHIDGKLFNDAVENMYLCTKEQRNALYSEQLKRRRPFASAKEIDTFLERIGRFSPEISKDKRIYERRYNTKIPLYWKQKELRKKQAFAEDPHPELREKLVGEIKDVEDKIEQKREESRFYTIPPKRHPELKKRLIDELREAEDKQKGIHRRRITLTEKIIFCIGIVAIIVLFIFAFKDHFFNNSNEIQSKPFDLSKSKLHMGTASEQLFSYEIRTDRYFILVINNEKTDLNLDIYYNRYSNSLDINENKTIQVSVPANDEVLVKDSGFSRDLGCVEGDCEVSIIYSKRT
jgi:hypothetical protein